VNTREIVVEPLHGWRPLDLRELWEARELLAFLVWRNLKARYQQTFLGAAWAVLQPVLTMVIFSVFLGRLARVPSDGLPYPLFAFCGLVPWTYFANSLTLVANSLVEHERMLSKVYFPRLVLPLARGLSLLVDLVIALAILVLLTLAYGEGLEPTLVLVPAFLALAVVTALGVGILLAALNVRYRDVTIAVPLIVQVWLFTSPVIYPGSLVEGAWRYVYALNPIVSVVDGVRWALLGAAAPLPGAVAISAAVALAVTGAGVVYFRMTEHYFADLI
jgi:lipopolysaccharide transport system permease protein